jgi:hypothetical protein
VLKQKDCCPGEECLGWLSLKRMVRQGPPGRHLEWQPELEQHCLEQMPVLSVLSVPLLERQVRLGIEQQGPLEQPEPERPGLLKQRSLERSVQLRLA